MAIPSVNIKRIDDINLDNQISEQVGEVSVNVNKFQIETDKKISEIADNILLNGSYIIKTGNGDNTFMSNYNNLVSLFKMDKEDKQKYLEVVKLYDTNKSPTNEYIYEKLKASLESDYNHNDINKIYNTLVFNYNNGDKNIATDFNNTMDIYQKLRNTNLDNIITADALWKNVASGDYVYGGTSVPANHNVIDCSSFISWILEENGYEEFEGPQHVTQQFVLTDWNKKYGWEEIPIAENEDVSSKLQIGDILVRDSGNNNGHMNIVADTINMPDGTVKILSYDCGGVDNWINSNGQPIDKTAFAVSDERPGKIIRIPRQ